jgi:two-component system nitrogen regulation response regulator NtrX
MTKVLIIDDEAPIRNSLREILEYEGCRVEEAEDGAKGLSQAVKFAFDLIFCDIKMPRMDGMDVLDMLREKGVQTPVVMISGHGTVEAAVEALKKGAFDFIQKPLDLNRILVTVRHAVEQQVLEEKANSLERTIQGDKANPIIGDSTAIESIKDRIATVAPTDARVLVTGPNGAGKELVARQLHAMSQRAAAPFIEVNCAAIPAELIESELFGHEKGSFTSAIKQRKGKFELAHGGTLFLDEVGDMSASAQAKVLRALQENRITRVGGDEDIEVDVRIVAATNRNLLEEIDGGRFREDLYHRLAVILIEVPSLNERREDVPKLVEFFLDGICKNYGMNPMKIDAKAIELLQAANWRGNIRELRNVVERLVILTPKGKAITSQGVMEFGGLSPA